MPDPQSIPQLLEVKKYPNRRLYDLTRSRHLTHEELYDLVVAGHTVRVTDSRSGADITNLVLVQALIERSPEKLASFPPEVAHLMIRATEHALRGIAGSWFDQLMRGASAMSGAAGTPFAGAWTPSAIFGGMTGATAPRATAAPQPSSHDESIAELRSQLDRVLNELAELKRRN